MRIAVVALSLFVVVVRVWHTDLHRNRQSRIAHRSHRTAHGRRIDAARWCGGLMQCRYHRQCMSDTAEPPAFSTIFSSGINFRNFQFWREGRARHDETNYIWARWEYSREFEDDWGCWGAREHEVGLRWRMLAIFSPVNLVIKSIQLEIIKKKQKKKWNEFVDTAAAAAEEPHSFDIQWTPLWR